MTLFRLMLACGEYTNITIVDEDDNILARYNYDESDDAELDAFDDWTYQHREDRLDRDFDFTINGNHMVITY